MDDFFKKLKLKTDKLVFISDLHLGHDKEFLYKNRNFNNIEDHDAFIFDKWIEYIDEKTTVICLGDICFNDSKSYTFYNFISLPYKELHLIKGNHNSGMKQFFSEPNRYFKNIFFHGDYSEGFINKQAVCLFHYPIFIWNLKQNGSFCLSGHSHGSCNYTNPNHSDFGKLGRVIDLSVETALENSNQERFFWTWNEIYSTLSKLNYE